MKKYKLTVVGLVISLMFFLATHIFDYDIFENIVELLEKAEKFEIDEIVMPIFISLLFATFDFFRMHKKNKIEIEKIKIYKAMLASTNHVLNNFLNQMLLFKLTADDTPGFDPEILSLYETIIKETSDQIKEPGSVTRMNESSRKASVAPK